MDSPISVVPTPYQFDVLQHKYGFLPEDGMTFRGENDSFINPHAGKIGIYVKHFDDGYRIPKCDFFREVLHHHKVHINQLVPNRVNKVVAVEMLCRAHGIAPDLWPSRSALIDPWTLDGVVESSDKKIVEEEVMEDNKDGIIPMVNKHKAVWQSVSDADARDLALVWRLRPRHLDGGSSKIGTVQNEVIDIVDNRNVEENVVL
ncbi:unnamed protein product [Lactuca virosa]|uniref:Transposase (putative) gypsy type domain-containing protein n=1 Tax=Lactuca virosa TaxID=75947 RepID=A0AAU9NRQ1_9ASTR|nr:unnamed protein product [Lactuca virosa]